MLCPQCQHGRIKVLETRQFEGRMYRKRRCLNPACEAVFHTQEVQVPGYPAGLKQQIGCRLGALPAQPSLSTVWGVRSR